MSEELQVKHVGEAEAPTKQEQETQVLEKAVEEGDITPEAAGIPNDGSFKINLDKTVDENKEANAVQQVQGETKEGVLRDERVADPSEEKQEEPDKPSGPIERIEDEVTPEKVEVAPVVEEAPPAPKVELPENVEKLVEFMKDTGGSVEDFVNLNKDIDKMDDVAVLKEWYRVNKPHLDAEEVAFLMDEAFYFDKEKDEPKEIKKKQLAFKEALYDAKKQLKGDKDKYYSELKFSNVTPEQKDALDFYNTSKKQEESNKRLVDTFKQKTDAVFNDEFKGFDFNVGEEKFRYKVSDKNQVKEYQSDINNLVGEFLGDDGTIKDAKGYHKALYVAKNADKLAQHFYEQGRADALTQNAKESKNIDMQARSDASTTQVPQTGMKFKVVDNDSSKLRFKPFKT